MQVHDTFAFLAELDLDERLQFLKKIDSNKLVSPLRYLMTSKECPLHPYVEALALNHLDKLLHISLSQHGALHYELLKTALSDCFIRDSEVLQQRRR